MADFGTPFLITSVPRCAANTRLPLVEYLLMVFADDGEVEVCHRWAAFESGNNSVSPPIIHSQLLQSARLELHKNARKVLGADSRRPIAQIEFSPASVELLQRWLQFAHSRSGLASLLAQIQSELLKGFLSDCLRAPDPGRVRLDEG